MEGGGPKQQVGPHLEFHLNLESVKYQGWFFRAQGLQDTFTDK